MLTGTTASCHDVHAWSKDIHASTGVVILIDQLIITSLWWVEFVGQITACSCNCTVDIGWSNLACVNLAVAGCHHHCDTVRLYQVGHCALQSLGPLPSLQLHTTIIVVNTSIATLGEPPQAEEWASALLCYCACCMEHVGSHACNDCRHLARKQKLAPAQIPLSWHRQQQACSNQPSYLLQCRLP